MIETTTLHLNWYDKNELHFFNVTRRYLRKGDSYG